MIIFLVEYLLTITVAIIPYKEYYLHRRVVLMGIRKLKEYNNIWFVDGFFDEYKSLFGKSATLHKKYLKKLQTNLRILDKEKRKATQYQQFEPVENTDYYSIRHVSKINDRVVYAYITPDEKIVLVTPFIEKSKADYKIATDKTKARLVKEGLI